MNEDKPKKEELIKEAYRFGYFVGYKGHSEWLSWIHEKKWELYEEAKKFGIYEAVKRAYQMGKEEGAKRRATEIQKGLGKEEGGKEGVRKAEEFESEVSEEELEREFLTILRSPEILEPPELLNLIKILKKPGLLDMPQHLGERG
ncbi:hypothetical protein [Palaeococcus sp. (in: euryarchaeotes)]|nr:MAG: hypothetical protein DRN39_07525 [Thermococci archaeon]